MLRLSATIILALAAAATSPSAPVPPRAAECYFPTTPGATWVYRYDRGNGSSHDRTETVSAVEAAGVAKVVTVSVSYSVEPVVVPVNPALRKGVEVVDHPNTKYRVGTDGVFVVADYDIVAEKWVERKEPECLLKLPAKAGESWSGADKAAGVEWTATTGKAERVKTAAGTYNAVPVRLECTFSGKKDVPRILWYAPNVGLVKATYGDDVVVEMIPFCNDKR